MDEVRTEILQKIFEKIINFMFRLEFDKKFHAS